MEDFTPLGENTSIPIRVEPTGKGLRVSTIANRKSQLFLFEKTGETHVGVPNKP